MFKRHVWIVVLAVLTGGAWGRMHGFATEPDSKPTIDDVVAAWKDRQERVNSARFEWSGSVTLFKYASAMGRAAIWSSQKITLEGAQTCSLTFDEQRLRMTSAGKRISGMRNGHEEWVDQTVTSVFDVTGSAYHYLKHASLEHVDPWVAPSVGFMYGADPAVPLSRNMHVDPILLHFRALGSSLSHIQGSLSVAERSLVFDAERCWVILEDGQQPTEYWVDPRRNFVIVRMRQLNYFKPGMCLIDTEISYQADPDVQWIPASWHATWFNMKTGEVSESCEYTVNRYVLNPAVDASVFELQFPPGTKVGDYREGSPPTQYIVREDGGKRIITPAESAADYKDLLRTKSGEARPIRRGWLTSRLGRLTLAIATGFLLLVVLYLVRRRRISPG